MFKPLEHHCREEEEQLNKNAKIATKATVTPL
jgi:hypothetical protein